MNFSFAEIYPLRPMPRRMGVFDYAIPQGMKCERGDLVEMPLRGKTILGIVATVKEGSGENMKTIMRVVETAYLSVSALAFLEALAQDLVQSPCSILAAALPLPPKPSSATISPAPESRRDPAADGGTIPTPLTLPADEAPLARQAIQYLCAARHAFICAPDLRRTAALVAGYLGAVSETRVALVLPHVRDAQLLHDRLSRFLPALLTGEETPHARFRAWNAFRCGQTRLLIGTRLVSLLPLQSHSYPSTLWLARSGHPHHKNADKNPRYDARSNAFLQAKLLGTKIICSDVMPQASDTSFFGQNMFDPFQSPRTIFADMAQERSRGIHPLLGPSLYGAVEKTIASGKRVLCVYNRLGTSSLLRCAHCGHTFACPTCAGVRIVEIHVLHCRHCETRESIPRSCPVCMEYGIERKGFGNRAIADALHEAFPKATMALVEKGNPMTDAVQIVLATQQYLENIFDPFTDSSLGLVALLDADAALRSPSFNATEQALFEAAQWRGVASASRADFLLQTYHVDLFRSGLENVLAFASEECGRRKTYHQPPSTRCVRILCKQRPANEARKASHVLVQTIREAFPTAHVDAGVRSAPNTSALEINIDHAQAADLLKFLRQTDDACIIDTHPFS